MISIGSISDTPKNQIEKYKPFADYLAGKLKAHGIVKGQVVISGSIGEMADFIKKGEVDFFIDSPFPTYRLSQITGIKPFLRRWKKGVPEYHSLIFVRQDSGIESLEDLKGKTLAFESPWSTSAFLIPKAAIIQKGLSLFEKESFTMPVPGDKVGYIFAEDEETIMILVSRKRVQGGALDNVDFGELSKGKEDQFKIIYRSSDMPRHVLSYRPGFDPVLLKTVEEILLQMDQNGEGRKILTKFEKTLKFDHFPKSEEETFAPIQELMDYIEDDFKRLI